MLSLEYIALTLVVAGLGACINLALCLVASESLVVAFLSSVVALLVVDNWTLTVDLQSNKNCQCRVAG